MTTPVACKTSYVMPPSGQYESEPVNLIVGQKGCDQVQEFNLMEMTEVEYTHLQHLIQSHMEVQEVAEEVRLNPASSECESPCTSPACQPDASSSSSLPTDVQFITVSSNQVSEDSQECKLLLYSDPNSISSIGESTPAHNSKVGVAVRMKCVMEAGRERNNHQRELRFGSRPNPPARVRLEKRFLSMIHNSTDMPGIAMHSQPEKWTIAEKTAVVECPHPYTGNQGLDHLSHLLEGSKHPEGIESMNRSVSVLRSPCIIYTDASNEEQVIDRENEVVEKTVNRAKAHRARILQSQDPNKINGSKKFKPACIMPGPKPDRRTRPPLGIKQRKERHNLKERDRRRRIRLCCDELNLLVPFCCAETDKATTLQWTTAYLKYIREVYGDSLKQAFQNTFCGKTGSRIKPSFTNDAVESENSASKE